MTDVQEEVKTDEKPDWHEEIGGLDVEPAKELAQDAPDAPVQEQEQQEQAVKPSEQNDDPEPLLEQERDYEAEAVKMGWKPDGAKSAQEFVEYGEKHKPANYAKLEIDKIKKDYESRFEAMQRTNQAVLDHQRQQIEARYDAQIRSAAEVGDMAAFDQHTQAKEQELQKFEQIPQAQPQQAPVEFITWKAQNDWDNWDAGKQAYAAATLSELMQQNPGFDQTALIPALDAKLANQFGGQQRVQRQQPRQLTDTGGRSRSKPEQQKSFSNLPKEAVEAFSEWQESGLNITKEKYAEIYFKENS